MVPRLLPRQRLQSNPLLSFDSSYGMCRIRRAS